MKLKFLGTLESYYETGMEGFSLQLYLDGYEIPNEKYNEKDRSFGPKFFHDWSGVINLDPGDKVKIISSPLKKYEGKVFTIGNLRFAKADRYRFGYTYPKEKISLQDWYDLFSSDKTRAEVIKKIKTIAYYGGTFDPVHEGHKSIIDTLRYKYDLVLILPGNNWTKENKPIFPIDQRINSLKAICKDFHNVIVLDWANDKEKDTSSTFLVAKEIYKNYKIKPYIVIGTDNLKSIEKWKFWDKLKNYQFIIFNRNNTNEEFPSFEKFIKKPVFWKFFKTKEEISSTMIRETKDTAKIPEEARACLDLTLLSQNGNNMIKK